MDKKETKSKYYFYREDAEMCVGLDSIKDMIKFDGLAEKEVYKAKMVTGDNVFYCRHFGEIGETGQGCGKECKQYKPRNGKNGRCKHSSNCYEPTEKILIKI